MNRLLKHALVITVLGLFAAPPLDAAPLSIAVDAARPGAKISPTMWGIFFEDINLGADGGLYAELIKNRSFEFPDAFMGWRKAPAPAAVPGPSSPPAPSTTAIPTTST